MKSLRKILSVISVSSVMILVLSGCGSNSQAKLLALCNEANSALSVLTTDDFVPNISADWSQIETTYSGVKSKLEDLSSQASVLDESQLARDFSSISKNAGTLEALASFVQLVGGSTTYAGDYVLQSEWLSAVNLLTRNEALRSPSDRTFIGCKSN